jgi:ribonuclease VapC
MIERIGTGPIILDASAALAVILGERRARALTGEILRRSVISTVNLAEVQSKLVRAGYDPEIAWEDALSVTAAVEPYTAEQAKIVGTLIAQTQRQGLSLGDRSCLALAIVRNAAVCTTDQVWQNLQIGVKVHIIR